MPRKSSTLHSSHPQILASSGTLSINNLLHRKPTSQLPSTVDSKSLPDMFASFFSNKVLKLHSALKSHLTNTSPHTEPSHVPTNLTFFYLAAREKISKLISQSSNTFCDLDPILLPIITNIVNLSLSSGVFPKQFKLSSVIPLLKKK